MKTLFLILIFGFYSITCFSQEVVSTELGGDWNNPKTWVSCIMPDANSNVVIKGHVTVKAPIECKNLKLMKDGKLEFTDVKDSIVAKVSETIDLGEGKIIISDKWKLFTNQLINADPKKIENNGTIGIGM